MILVAGNTVHTRLGVLTVHPGLENSPRLLLVAGQAVADLFFGPYRGGNKKKKKDGRKGCFSEHGPLL
jgi:hypothetical protein